MDTHGCVTEILGQSTGTKAMKKMYIYMCEREKEYMYIHNVSKLTGIFKK